MKCASDKLLVSYLASHILERKWNYTYYRREAEQELEGGNGRKETYHFFPVYVRHTSSYTHYVHSAAKPMVYTYSVVSFSYSEALSKLRQEKRVNAWREKKMRETRGEERKKPASI